MSWLLSLNSYLQVALVWILQIAFHQELDKNVNLLCTDFEMPVEIKIGFGHITLG